MLLKLKRNFGIIFSILACFLFVACNNSQQSGKELITLTMWHVYGAQTYSPMNTMIEKFNQGVGKEHGIKIVVSSVSNSTAIHDALVSAAKNEAGAPELPDLFTCYPKTLKAMGLDNALDWNDYFSDLELSTFVPQFIEEGKFDKKLLIFPISKSSNALFINANVFEKFAKETNYNYESLSTWEEMFQLTEDYYNWSGGKAFFMYDDWIHYPMVSMQAFDTSLFRNNQIAWDNLYFKKVMEPLIRAGIKGEICLMPGYSTKAIMIDAAIAGVESTASVLYFKDNVTYPDNSTAPLKVKAVPVPYFEKSSRIALQRGTGLVALKSTKQKEEAAAIFCKWITAENTNLEFVMQGGYLPVRKSDYARLNQEIENFDFPRERYRSLYQAIVKIHQENKFMTAPSFDAYGDIEQEFPKALREVLLENHNIWLDEQNKNDYLLDMLVEKSFIQLQEKVEQYVKDRS